jgi:hypothetical protein
MHIYESWLLYMHIYISAYVNGQLKKSTFVYVDFIYAHIWNWSASVYAHIWKLTFINVHIQKDLCILHLQNPCSVNAYIRKKFLLCAYT